MSLLSEVRRLMAHLEWADRKILAGFRERSPVPAAALRELGHILGATEVWLARIERRAPRAGVWPELSLDEADALASAVHTGYTRYLAAIDEAGLGESVSYINSAGQPFTTPVKDILLHVSTHGQYHRGKINVHLRQAGLEPISTDYIAFVRGTPAATTPVSGSAERA